MTIKSRTFSTFPTLCARVQCGPGPSPSAEQSVARVAETGHDICLVVEPLIHRGDVNRHFRVERRADARMPSGAATTAMNLTLTAPPAA